jgi:hypothetical protein
MLTFITTISFINHNSQYFMESLTESLISHEMSFPHTHELRRMFSRTPFYVQTIIVCFAFVIALESCSLPSKSLSLAWKSSFLTCFPTIARWCNPSSYAFPHTPISRKTLSLRFSCVKSCRYASLTCFNGILPLSCKFYFSCVKKVCSFQVV